jgi:4-hydroxybenzoyl-CoA thioesterase/acyl-CoA thioester hydrolase
MSEYEGCEIGWPRVATSCEYFTPVKFEQVLELVLRVVRVGTRSITYEIEFRHEGRRVALGRSTAVCCQIVDRGFRPIAIPDPLRQALVASAEAP